MYPSTEVAVQAYDFLVSPLSLFEFFEKKIF